MTKVFRHKGLELFVTTGSQKGIQAAHAKRLRLILSRLVVSSQPEDMNLPGLRLHELSGDLAGNYAVSVSGNWRVTFRFEDGRAVEINLVDYH